MSRLCVECGRVKDVAEFGGPDTTTCRKCEAEAASSAPRPEPTPQAEKAADTVTVKEAAKVLGVHVATVINAIKSGKLRASQTTGPRGTLMYIIEKASLDALKAERAVNPPTRGKARKPAAKHPAPPPKPQARVNGSAVHVLEEECERIRRKLAAYELVLEDMRQKAND